MKTIKSKRIGLFYLAIVAEFSPGTVTTKYFVFLFFFRSIHSSLDLIASISSAVVKENTEKVLCCLIKHN